MHHLFGLRSGRKTRTYVAFLVGFVLAGSSFAAQPPLDLDQYHGKVVVLDFWASWCVPCRRSFPWLNKMQKKYGDEGLVIVGVNMDASSQDAQIFLRTFPADFEIFYDPTGTVAKQYKVEAMPTSFVIDRFGTVVVNHLGFKVKKQDEYEQVLNETLHAGKE